MKEETFKLDTSLPIEDVNTNKYTPVSNAIKAVLSIMKLPKVGDKKLDGSLYTESDIELIKAGRRNISQASKDFNDVAKLPAGTVDEEQPFQFHGEATITSDTELLYLDEAENVCVRQLYFIKRFHPNVLKDFIDNNYGK